MYLKGSFLFLIAFLLAFSVKAQDTSQVYIRPLIIKTNLLSLVARKPTFAAEKIFRSGYGIEFSLVQGRFEKIAGVREYTYQGALLRCKRYLDKEFRKGNFNNFFGVYGGVLQRDLHIDPFIIRYQFTPERIFSVTSIRSGLTFGTTFLSNKNVSVEILYAAGYGRYLDAIGTDSRSLGHLDIQIWFSVGFAF